MPFVVKRLRVGGVTRRWGSSWSVRGLSYPSRIPTSRLPSWRSPVSVADSEVTVDVVVGAGAGQT
jgi:hypothetical protein